MRNRFFWVLAAVVVFSAGTAAASPVTFFDIDAHGGTKLSARGTSSLSDVFDVTAAGIEGDSFWIGLPYSLFPSVESDAGGFVVGTHSAIDATLELWVRDDFDPFRAERLAVTLGGLSQGTPIEVDFGVESIGVSASLLAQIDATGQLSYTLTATQGDFRVDYVGLTVIAEAGGAAPPAGIPPVPEASAVGAYAAGVLLVAALVRRRS